jgi:hypothetical protein
MKARALIDGAPFGSETVKAIGEVFDQASARINRIFGNDPDAAEAERLRLAEAIACGPRAVRYRKVDLNRGLHPGQPAPSRAAETDPSAR